MYTRKGFFQKMLSTWAGLGGLVAMQSSCASSNEKPAAAIQNKKPLDCADLSMIPETELKKRIQFGYESESSAPDRNCGSCALFVLPAKLGDCAGCMLFQGPVSEKGSCIQFAVKT